MKKAILCLSIISGLYLSGCTTFRVRVNGFSDISSTPKLASGASIFVVENQKAENPFIEKEITSKVVKLLQKNGYKSSTFENADYYLLFGYGIGTGRSISGVLPLYQRGGTATVNTQTSSGWSQSTVQLPGSTTFVPYSRTVYDRWLLISVVDGKQYRDNNDIQTVWYGEITSTGRTSDLRTVINYLLIAAFEHFGENTGKAVRIDIIEGDRRVREIEK